MNSRNLTILNEGKRKPFLISKRGCSHCRKRTELLVSEDTCPRTYRCPCCKSQWLLLPEVKVDLEDFLRMSDEERREFLVIGPCLE